MHVMIVLRTPRQRSPDEQVGAPAPIRYVCSVRRPRSRATQRAPVPSSTPNETHLNEPDGPSCPHVPVTAIPNHTGTKLPIELLELAPETRVSFEAEAVNQIQGM